MRRAFLCSKDAGTGTNFDHRRSWIQTRLHEVAEIFATALCTCAVMSNHHDVALRIDSSLLENLSDGDEWAY